MIVSTLSCFLSGSKYTRLLKQGLAGQTTEMVAVSCIAKPWGRSSRSITLNEPPDFGVWLSTGRAAMAAASSTAATVNNSVMREDRVMRRPPCALGIDRGRNVGVAELCP